MARRRRRPPAPPPPTPTPTPPAGGTPTPPAASGGSSASAGTGASGTPNVAPGLGFPFKVGGGQTFPTLAELTQQTADSRAETIAQADAFKNWHLYAVTVSRTALHNLRSARTKIQRIPGGTR